MSTAQRQQLSSFWTGSLHWDVDMGPYCTLRAGGRAETLAVARSLLELSRLIAWLDAQNIRWRVIGRGSNILVGSQGYAGVLIVLDGDFRVIRLEEEKAEPGIATLLVGAGCPVGRVVGWAARHGLSGLEFMIGIPGSIGGAVRMNAGAWGHEIGPLVAELTLVDRRGDVHHISREDIVFGYRQMEPCRPELNDAVVAEARLVLREGNQADILGRCRDYMARRREKQPAGMASAGSFFKNPPGDFAGRLIEAAGLKGLHRGGAMVSPKHANFIVNTGNASAADIVGLMQEVQEKVYRFFGVRLEPEVHLL